MLTTSTSVSRLAVAEAKPRESESKAVISNDGSCPSAPARSCVWTLELSATSTRILLCRDFGSLNRYLSKSKPLKTSSEFGREPRGDPATMLSLRESQCNNRGIWVRRCSPARSMLQKYSLGPGIIFSRPKSTLGMQGRRTTINFIDSVYTIKINDLQGTHRNGRQRPSHRANEGEAG